jgi:hypothetical protein
VLKNVVQEIQGLYGSFCLSERVVQKIWLKGEFDQSALQTESGRRLRVIDPGRWNLLEGPDFLEARLELDGEERIGDVEVHFHVGDWHLHDHGSNPRFGNVCLHVVLYPETRTERAVTTSRGTQPEVLCLLPLLERDLEDYAVEDALLELEQVEDAEWMLRFMEEPLEDRRARIRKGADARWTGKVEFAAKRLRGSSWRAACHQYCLEVLGYSRNRAPMARLALGHTIDDFATGQADPDTLFGEFTDSWRLSGLRPANHPRHRLVQYAGICRAHPDWPERLARLLSELEAGDGALTGAAFRKRYSLADLTARIAHEVFSDMLSAKRLNTLICDALLPLAQAAGIFEAEVHWRYWPAGDAPERLHAFLKQARIVDRSEPFSNGQIQGGLHWLIER